MLFPVLDDLQYFCRTGIIQEEKEQRKGEAEMIELHGITKSFDGIKAVNDVSMTIHGQDIFGLLGVNGAGKSTLLRLTAGILSPDSGQIFMDGKRIADDRKQKSQIFYLSDDQYFFPNATLEMMRCFYDKIYPEFSREDYECYLQLFGLDPAQKIRTFSKGMKRQSGILLALSSHARYLLCDEVFDGLDPIVRQSVKQTLTEEARLRGLTIIMASHNLGELEGICDHIGILHKGGILLSKDLEKMQEDVHKFQCVFHEQQKEYLKERLEILHYEKLGFLETMTVRGKQREICEIIESRKPVIYEELPLSLEEIFVGEMERIGYDISKYTMEFTE